jgi:hypothetical protein
MLENNYEQSIWVLAGWWTLQFDKITECITKTIDYFFKRVEPPAYGINF